MKLPLLRTTLLAALLGGMLSPAAAEGLGDVYRLAAETDPGLAAADAARRAVLEAEPQARALLLPSVALSGSYARNSYDPRNPAPGEKTSYSTNQSYALSLTQPIYRHDRFVALAQAGEQVAQAEAEYAAAEQELMVRVAERYFAVLGAQDDLEFAEAEKAAIARQHEQAQQRFEVGLIAITDVQEAQARYDLAVAQEIAARDRLASARDALRELLGTLPETLDVLAPPLDLAPPEPDSADAWVERALADNLALLAARAGVAIAREEIRRQRAGHLPTLDLTASYTYQDSNFGGIAAIERNDGSIGLSLNVPIYQGGLVSSRTRAASHRLVEAQQQLEAQNRTVARQARDAYRGVVTGIAQVRALLQALKSSETALEAAETGFEVGTRTIVDVLDAQRERYRAERDLQRARYDYLLNSLRLKQAAGALAPGDIEALDRWLKPPG